MKYYETRIRVYSPQTLIKYACMRVCVCMCVWCDQFRLYNCNIYNATRYICSVLVKATAQFNPRTFLLHSRKMVFCHFATSSPILVLSFFLPGVSLSSLYW